MICPECSREFTPSTARQKTCSRICGNNLRRPNRSTASKTPCPCGSGLPAKRTTIPNSPGFGLRCAACKITIPAADPVALKRILANEHDIAQARARRVLEARREAAAMAQGDVW